MADSDLMVTESLSTDIEIFRNRSQMTSRIVDLHKKIAVKLHL